MYMFFWAIAKNCPFTRLVTVLSPPLFSLFKKCIKHIQLCGNSRCKSKCSLPTQPIQLLRYSHRSTCVIWDLCSSLGQIWMCRLSVSFAVSYVFYLASIASANKIFLSICDKEWVPMCSAWKLLKQMFTLQKGRISVYYHQANYFIFFSTKINIHALKSVFVTKQVSTFED